MTKHINCLGNNKAIKCLGDCTCYTVMKIFPP